MLPAAGRYAFGVRFHPAGVRALWDSPVPEINLLDFKLEGAVIAVRPYTHTDHYWQVYFDTNQAMMRVAKEAGWPAPTRSPRASRT